ncbi:MAG: class I SAM-dependent methyltransferase [Chitinivibrionia bacterium]|nr:class I SAM-dependent methyltransferase [Chitinivibrionia bacterium]
MGKKDIYASGEYSRFFSPESASFPFARLYDEKRRLILERASEGGRDILDLGGGRGRYSIPLAANNRVCLADLSLQMIEEALEAGHARASNTENRAERGSLTAVCCDAEFPPFRRESFDVLLAIDLLPHVSSPDRLAGAIFDLLRPGGTAIVDNSNSSPFWMFAFPGYVNWKRRPIRFLRTFLHGGVLPDWTNAIVHLNKDEFTGCLAGAGFAIVDFMELGPSYCPKWHLAFCRKPNA